MGWQSAGRRVMMSEISAAQPGYSQPDSNPGTALNSRGIRSIQWAFTLFVLFETWLVPFEAYLADRFGPRPLVMIGAFLIALCWIIYSRATTLNVFYVGAAIGGIGTGLVYGTCIGNAVKWFEKRRGLAEGLTAAGHC